MAAPAYRQLRLDQLNLPQPAIRKGRRGLEELRKSIEQVGVVVPLVVRALGKKEYAVIAGAGRLEALRASGAAASSSVPCIVVDVDDAKATLLSLVENTVREAMTPLEEAEVARTLVEEYGYRQGQVADTIGRTQSMVSKWLTVFRLDRQVVAALRNGKIGMSAALALLPLKNDARTQRRILKEVLQKGLDATHTAALVSAHLSGPSAVEPQRYTVRDAGQVDVRTTRSGGVQVLLKAKDRAALGRLLTSVRKNVVG